MASASAESASACTTRMVSGEVEEEADVTSAIKDVSALDRSVTEVTPRSVTDVTPLPRADLSEASAANGVTPPDDSAEEEEEEEEREEEEEEMGWGGP